MRLGNSVLVLVIRTLIWPSETLAASFSQITRDDQNKTRNGTETKTHRDPPAPKSSAATGLGSDPVHTGHGQSHDAHFFDATPANIKASRFGAAYADWIQAVDKSSPAWRERLSEPDFFAKTVLEWEDDVNCGVTYNGCDGRPLCSEISKRIENRERARQICYIFDSFHHVSLITAQIHVGVPVAPSNVLWRRAYGMVRIKAAQPKTPVKPGPESLPRPSSGNTTSQSGADVPCLLTS